MRSSPGGDLPIASTRTSERGQTLRDTLLVFSATVAINVANFGFHFGAVRLLGLPVYSELAALYAIVLIFSVPANAIQAVVAALVGEIPDEDRAISLTNEITRVAAFLAIGLMALGLLASSFIASYLQIADVPAVGLVFVVVGIGFLVATRRGGLQGRQRFGLFSTSLILEAVGNIVFGLGFVLLFRSLRSAFAGNVLAVGIVCGLLLWGVWRRGAHLLSDAIIRRALAKSIGTITALATIAAMSWFDLILVRHLMPVAAASLYAALSIVGKTILFSVSFVPLVLLAKTSKLKSQNRETRPIFMLLVSMGLAFCCVELVILGVFPQLVLRIVAGPAAVAGAGYLLRYGIAMASLAITTVVANYSMGKHRFAFVYPLLLIECGEIATINIFHSSLDQVIAIIVAGHIGALIASTLTVYLGGARRRVTA